MLVHSEQLCKGVIDSTTQWGWTEMRTPVQSRGADAPFAAFYTPQRTAAATPTVLQRSCPGTARWAWSRARAVVANVVLRGSDIDTDADLRSDLRC